LSVPAADLTANSRQWTRIQELGSRDLSSIRVDLRSFAVGNGTGSLHDHERQALFLQMPQRFICSQSALICSRWLLTEKPSFCVIWPSSRSIFSLSNSTIRSQSLQMM